MHEFSLAQGLHDQLLDLAHEHEAQRVQKAEICIGENAGIVVESFLFGFDVLASQNDITRDTELVVERDDGRDLILMRLELS
ncbi:hydrogenase maturation nickel metallochaperone HypA [Desulfotalea psychrophila]|uniref:Similar to hydrogenase expression/formation protein (HypA) n=1 Tax=Desulfotalea psychrophila (strain LSv54 / DSM 12343) TaxID=177439 RepID=Q6API0_DESPS|nr:hydrogenase maturation nickel metallochaperone HypA [Desulfotalea psychrophila]CAG35744.1 similar to hydrogenase expression/formation protein (HypA) [Desulfotalea psychrophila LSv54]